MKKLVRILLIVLAVVIGFAAIGGGTAWWYLARIFEEPPLPVVAAETQRSVQRGDIVGYVDRADTYAWLGIPFAAPPVGDLRWRAPPAAGRLDGRAGSPGTGTSVSAEAVPGRWRGRRRRGLPVPERLVPGGSRRLGSPGSGDVLDTRRRQPYRRGRIAPVHGANLAGAHDVVVVSFNYRLGPLGWLRHPALRGGEDPADDSGNYGVLDIVHALHWVQANVETFGGDPDNVTIFGESAGGWNVVAMMVSPLAAGLYHKAIVQSGGLRLAPVAEAEEYAVGDATSSRDLVDNLLMADDASLDRDAARGRQAAVSDGELAGYLRSKTASEILAAQGSASLGGTPTLFGDGHVMPDDLQTGDLFAAGRYNVTPVILGTNRDEMKLFASLSGQATERLFGVIPYRIRDPERHDRDTGYGSDAWKVRGVDSLAAPLRASQGPTVFAYRFDWDAMRTVGTLDLGRLVGAAHALEIPFVFGNLDFLDRLAFVEDEDVPERDALSRR